MKGPSGKGDQFVELEYMKGGQMVTHPCAPLPRIKFFIRSLSPSPGPDKPLLPPTVPKVPHGTGGKAKANVDLEGRNGRET